MKTAMSAYIVVEAKITDRERFVAYAQAVPPLVRSMGGEYLALGGESKALEGDWGETKIVLHRWPNMQAAEAFWYSDDYQKIKQLRSGTGVFRVMLVDGIQSHVLES